MKIVHMVYRFDVGGLENGVVNLINSTPEIEHVVIALTDATEFADRIDRSDVPVYALAKQGGNDLSIYRRLYRLLRELKPDVFHTRNIGTLDCQLVALLARVRTRIHGEHGWDVYDADGRNVKYRMLRRLIGRFVARFVVVSKELQAWLIDEVGIRPGKVTRICNGVDVRRFTPKEPSDKTFVIGSVTRFAAIKDPLNVVRAFIQIKKTRVPNARLLMVGDGPLRQEAMELIESAGLTSEVCFPGNQADIQSWLPRMDVFVLGSRREGISNTILEAMSAGLPVVATDVGGTRELVEDGVTGLLVLPGSAEALTSALARYADDPHLREKHGGAGRKRAVQEFSTVTMVAKYRELYATAAGNRAA